MTTESYQSYVKWKKWDRPVDGIPPYRARYFKAELAKTGVKKPARILEVGYGKGEFLVWAKEHGFEVCGVELIKALVADAEALGLNVFQGNPAQSDFRWGHDPVDVVAAFDVIEHLDLEEFRTFLNNLTRILKPGGKAIFRFPNAGSPFGQILLNGDYTHKMAMTRTKMEQILVDQPFHITAYGNTARVIRLNSPFALLKYLTFGIRELTEWIWGISYYGCKVPMDKNSVAVLEFKG